MKEGEGITKVRTGNRRWREVATGGCLRKVPSFQISEIVWFWRSLELEDLRPPASLFAFWIRSVRHFTLPQNKQKGL